MLTKLFWAPRSDTKKSIGKADDDTTNSFDDFDVDTKIPQIEPDKIPEVDLDKVPIVRDLLPAKHDVDDRYEECLQRTGAEEGTYTYNKNEAECVQERDSAYAGGLEGCGTASILGGGLGGCEGGAYFGSNIAPGLLPKDEIDNRCAPNCDNQLVTPGDDNDDFFTNFDTNFDDPSGSGTDDTFTNNMMNTGPVDPVVLPNDGRNQFDKGADKNAETWRVVPMNDDPSKFKIIDGSNINVADLFQNRANAEQFIDYYKTNQN